MSKYKNICVNTNHVSEFISYFKAHMRHKFIHHPLDDLLSLHPIIKVIKEEEYFGENCDFLILINPSTEKIATIKTNYKNSLIIINQEILDACLIFDWIDESLIFWKKDILKFNSLFSEGADVAKIF